MTKKQRKNLERQVQSICAIGMLQCLLVMAILMGLGVLAVFATLSGDLTIIDLVCLLAIIPIVIFVLIWLIIRRISKKTTGVCLAKREKHREEAPIVLSEAPSEEPVEDNRIEAIDEGPRFGVLSEKDFL